MSLLPLNHDDLMNGLRESFKAVNRINNLKKNKPMPPTQPLTVEQLMASRVIVENLWPDCQFNVGDILEKVDDFYYSRKGFIIKEVHQRHVEQFPYLMRPLKWWEGRKETELPLYLKHTDGRVFKVIKYLMGEPDALGVYFESMDIIFSIKRFTPATLGEYNLYLESIK